MNDNRTPEINEHNKQEYLPMHTTEYLLNGEITGRYKCGRDGGISFTGGSHEKIGYKSSSGKCSESVRII